MIYGGSGNDAINAQNGSFDHGDCGLYAASNSTRPDHDTANVDVGLDRTVECERVF